MKPFLAALRAGVMLPDVVDLLLVLVVDPLLVEHLVAVQAAQLLHYVELSVSLQQLFTAEGFVADITRVFPYGKTSKMTP